MSVERINSFFDLSEAQEPRRGCLARRFRGATAKLCTRVQNLGRDGFRKSFFRRIGFPERRAPIIR